MTTTSPRPLGDRPAHRRRVTAVLVGMLLPLSLAVPGPAAAGAPEYGADYQSQVPAAARQDATDRPSYGADYQSQVPAAARLDAADRDRQGTADRDRQGTAAHPRYGADYQAQVPAAARGVRPPTQRLELLGGAGDVARAAGGCDPAAMPSGNPREHVAHRDVGVAAR